jgi:hypothetical protein
MNHADTLRSPNYQSYSMTISPFIQPRAFLNKTYATTSTNDNTSIMNTPHLFHKNFQNNIEICNNEELQELTNKYIFKFNL